MKLILQDQANFPMSQEINDVSIELVYSKPQSKLMLDGIIFTDIYYIDIIIDGVNIRNFNDNFVDSFVVYPELQASIEDQGKYLIFTCACGVADDGGWSGVDVIFMSDIIKWIICMDEQKVEFVFKRSKLKSEINMLAESMDKAVLEKLEPKFVEFPEEW